MTSLANDRSLRVVQNLTWADLLGKRMRLDGVGGGNEPQGR